MPKLLGIDRPASPVITPWVSYTPTLQGFGTVTGLAAEWRRVGDTLQVRASWVNGTVTGVEGQLSFPSGLTSTASSVLHNAGSFINSNNSSDNRMNLYVGSSTSYFNFSRDGTMTAALGNAFNNSETMKILGVARISNWSVYAA